MAVKAFVWTTVAELKVYLGIPAPTTDFDAVLEDLLNQSARKIENSLGRSIVDDENDITEIQDGDPDNEGQWFIKVRSGPINAFTSLAFNTGTSSTPIWTVEDADNFVRDDSEGVLYIADKFDQYSRPIPNGRQNVRIIYQGGWVNDATNMPDDLILALHMMAAQLNEKRKSQGIESESVSGTNIKWSKEMDSCLKQIMDTYRNYF